MARLVLSSPSLTAPQEITLRKKLTTLGQSPSCDIVLSDASVAPVQAHILQDTSGFTIATQGLGQAFTVNGKATKRHRLKAGDRVEIANFQLVFSPRVTAPPPAPAAPATLTVSSILPRLLAFSERVASDVTSASLFRTLLDQVIEVTGASKGFLVLIDKGGQVTIPVSRNINQRDLNAGPEALSDSILGRVLNQQEALIVSDATSDSRFCQAKSVVDLKLSSVMCAPLVFRNQLMGALYLGNDQVASLFTEVDLEALRIYAAQAALILHNAQQLNELLVDNKSLRNELEVAGLGRIIGQSQVMRGIFRKIDRLADTDISVLVVGETGTGKELIARELHARSTRKDKPFISINCGAIPEHLLESELFGHVKGAFTGAITQRIGRFEAADGGTLFLDEIGEMPLTLQVKLLRVLQQRTIERVGESRERPIDIRIVSATNQDLEKMVEDGRFREDLYYRLNEVAIPVPALRERGEDIVLLAQYYLDRFIKRYDTTTVKGFSKGALDAMRKYIWPGNVRQLENRIKKAVILSDRSLLSPDDMGIKLDRSTMTILPLKAAQDAFSLQYVKDVLEANNWNKSQTARDLEIDPRTVFRYAERLTADES